MTEPTERVRELLRHTADHIPGGPVTVPAADLVAGVAPPRRRRGLRLAAVFALALLAVAAPVMLLGDRDPRVPSAIRHPATSPPATGPPTKSAPTEVDCGTFQLGRDKELPRAAIGCFERALASGRPARLRFSRLTTEGDPIVYSYRSDGSGRVEVVTDTTRDNFGAKQVVRQICTGATPGTVFTFSRCSPPVPTTP